MHPTIKEKNLESKKKIVKNHLEGSWDKLLLIELSIVVDVQLLENLLCSLFCYVLEIRKNFETKIYLFVVADLLSLIFVPRHDCNVLDYLFSSLWIPIFVNDVLIKVKIWWWVKSKCAWTERCHKIQNWAFDKQTKPKIASSLTVRVSVLTRNTQIWKLGAPPSEGQQKSKYRWKMTIDSWQRSQFWQEWHKTKKPPTCVSPSREQRFVMISVISVESIVPWINII